MPLKQWCQAGPLPPVSAGSSFWANSRQQAILIAAGQARNWVNGDPPAPPAEPRYTASGLPGFGSATSNSSH